MRLCIDFMQQERVAGSIESILAELQNDLSVGLVKAMGIAAKVLVFKEATETKWFKELKDEDVYAALNGIVSAISGKENDDDKIYLMDGKNFTEVSAHQMVEARAKINAYAWMVVSQIANKLNCAIVVEPNTFMGIVTGAVDNAISVLMERLIDTLNENDELLGNVSYDITWPYKVEDGITTYSLIPMADLLGRLDTTMLVERAKKAKLDIIDLCCEEINSIFKEVQNPINVETRESF
ncbi:MAG: hypothetical protein ACRDBQ_18115 [Shewanella sp.]